MNNLQDYTSIINCPLTREKQINKKHPCYFQMQHQMLVTGLSYCDFFVWSKNDFELVRVERDNELYAKLKDKLEKVFFQEILPELVTRNKDTNHDYPQKLCIAIVKDQHSIL